MLTIKITEKLQLCLTLFHKFKVIKTYSVRIMHLR